MGGHAWTYFVPYEPDILAAMQALRRREFEAGRYHPAVRFPMDRNVPSPGAQHASIEGALEASDADGTRSILDMERIEQTSDLGVVVLLPLEQLEELYGNQQPTRKMIEQNMDFLDDIERGEGVYVIVYKEGSPSEIFFAGFSYD
jgi:hypothetical protein